MVLRWHRGFLDPHFYVPWLLIILGGLVMLYSVSSPPPLEYGQEGEIAAYTISRDFFTRQLIWAIVGFLAMVVGATVPFWIYKDYLSWILYGVGLLLLLLLLILPPMRGDTQRWLAIGPVGLQPSELFKVILIFMLASVLAAQRGDPNRLSLILITLVLVLPPTFLVLKQPDLGTALVFFGIMIPMLIWRGLDLRRVLLMAAPGLSGFIILYGEASSGNVEGMVRVLWGLFMVGLFLMTLYYREMAVRERIVFFLISIMVGLAVPAVYDSLLGYQQKRIQVFFDPGMDKLGAGYQIFQSKVAIGSGGVLGRGYLQGTQKGLAFLPARHTDFIFSVVGEEFGFLGALVLLGLYAYLIYQGYHLALKARHPFGQLLAVGGSSLLLFHVFVNVGMTVGLMPVTGLPLPGFSFGGSVLVAVSFLIGVQMNISRNWGRY